MPLTNIAIKAAKPRPKPYKLSDEKGLYLSIEPTGGKLWRFKYRYGGKEKKLSIGSYPDIGLMVARELRDAARRLLASGGDPGTEKRLSKLKKVAGAVNTFRAVGEELIAKKEREGLAKVTLDKWPAPGFEDTRLS
jgi:hypothetical protein